MGSDTVTVTVVNLAPIADAGGPYSVDEGSTVGLSGTGTDVPADVLTYEWDLDDDGLFDDATGQTPTFDASLLDGLSVHTVSLRVTDDDGDFTTDSTTVTVDNVAPTVSATGDSINEGETATVNVSFSDPGDPDTHTATIDWDDGSAIENLGTVTSPFNPTHEYANDGSFTVTITVTDDNGGVGSDTAPVTVNSLNSPPVADAGGPYTTDEGSVFILNASASSDPDQIEGDILSYEWDLDDDGLFDDAVGSNPSVSFPDNGVFTIGVRVTDTFGPLANIAFTTITVANVVPTSDAGGPYTVDEGSSIGLSGSGTDVPADILTYDWDLDNDGLFDDASGQSPSFDALLLDGPSVHTVSLRVTDDDGDSTTDSTTVTVANVAPVADAGGPYSVDEGSTVGLSGSGADVPADALTYEWDFDDDGLFDDAIGQNPVFDSALLAGASSQTLSLRVRDDDGGFGVSTTTVTLLSETGVCECTKSQGFWKQQLDPKKLNSGASKFTTDELEAFLAIVNSSSGLWNALTMDGANNIFDPPKSGGGNNGPGSGNGTKSGRNDAGATTTGGDKKKKKKGTKPGSMPATGGGTKDNDTKPPSKPATGGGTKDKGTKPGSDPDTSRQGVDLSKFEKNAVGQTLAAWLNFTKGAIEWDERVDVDGDSVGDMTFGELIAEVEGLLMGENPTKSDFKRAKDLAEAVNLHDEDNPDCETGSGTGTGSKSGTGSGTGTGSKSGTGSRTGTGSRSGTGSGTGTGSKSGAGSGSNTGTGSGTGTGKGTKIGKRG